MTSEIHSPTSEDAPKRKPPLHRRVTTEIGRFISPEEVRDLPSNARKIIKELLVRIDSLKTSARIDTKTGLPNDDDCRDELQQMIKRRPLEPADTQRKSTPYPLPTVVLLDMNGLGRINKRYSHAAGDLAIKHIASILKNNTCLRDTDYVARAGLHSDEFTIIMRDISPAKAQPILDNLLEEIKKTPIIYRDAKDRQKKITISACYGMARMEYGDNIDALRERVSKSLLEAKDRYYGRTSQNPVKKEEPEFGAGIPDVDHSLPPALGRAWEERAQDPPPSPTSRNRSSR